MLVGDEVQLSISYNDNEMARKMGCWYDSFMHSWFCSPNNANAIAQFKDPAPKVYYKVPFERKDEAKQLGMRWDKDRKLWYYQAHTPLHECSFQSLEEIHATNVSKLTRTNQLKAP